mgnify:CR=1 FL=1|tara:strand:- start:362 stop:562 length:201 start_codon:yes stop_codon:yes gene_type:complete
MTQPQELLQQRIEDKFEELGERMKDYAFSNSVDDWHACINMLPEIADLVNVLKQEADIADGKFPFN